MYHNGYKITKAAIKVNIPHLSFCSQSDQGQFFVKKKLKMTYPPIYKHAISKSKHATKIVLRVRAAHVALIVLPTCLAISDSLSCACAQALGLIKIHLLKFHLYH